MLAVSNACGVMTPSSGNSVQPGVVAMAGGSCLIVMGAQDSAKKQTNRKTVVLWLRSVFC